MTFRDEAKGLLAAEPLKKEGLDIRCHPLDVSIPSSIAAFMDFISKEYAHGLDVLINNAGIFLDKAESSVLKADLVTIHKTFQTNLYGPLLMCQTLAPFLAKKKGRIINLSSGMGQLAEMTGGYPAYRLSKTALNAVTRMLAAELPGVSVNSVCPGWVKTDMGGAGAELPVEKGADTAVWLADEADPGLTGGFYRNRKPIAW
jgi:NAD(P)-dependent dehydrogenase (short-subunit alcohol dehydrogenase family)